MKPVLVHSCFRAQCPFAVGSGSFSSQPIFHENPNASCDCHFYVKFRVRDVMLATGAAFVIASRLLSGWHVEWREVVLAGKSKGPPWVDTIRIKDIERMIDGSHWHTERIETYGALGRAALVEPAVKLERDLLVGRR